MRTDPSRPSGEATRGGRPRFAVSVGVEPGARPDPVLVDDAQRAEAHVLGIVIVAEREGVAAVEPSEVGDAALLGGSDGDHGGLLGLVDCRTRNIAML